MSVNKKSPSYRQLIALDHQHSWHPFTQMQDWMESDPILISSGKGSVLTDRKGRTYLDANASIWTNLHGHRHPAINRAIRKQLDRISHSSYLGLANEPASLLAGELVHHANPASLQNVGTLNRVFYSDDGSTAMETALKMAYTFAQRVRNHRKPRFASVDQAYHGDTLGAVSVGHIDLFHKSYGGLLFPSASIPSPYCYRCPFNKARPERADARSYRRCGWECTNKVDQVFTKARRQGNPISGLVVEPLMQGAAGMVPQPHGWLRKISEITRSHGALLIADEVMTAFGRTTEPKDEPQKGLAPLLACHQEQVQPDIAGIAKGLSGGYLPFAATLASDEIFGAFLGSYPEFKTFFHGHSYTGNQLGAAASLASLELLAGEKCRKARASIAGTSEVCLGRLWNLQSVGDVRRAGTVTGVELVRDWKTREPIPLEERAGIRVCQAMARMGVLTRPIGNVVVLMPPYSTSRDQVARMFEVLERAIRKVLK